MIFLPLPPPRHKAVFNKNIARNAREISDSPAPGQQVFFPAGNPDSFMMRPIVHKISEARAEPEGVSDAIPMTGL